MKTLLRLLFACILMSLPFKNQAQCIGQEGQVTWNYWLDFVGSYPDSLDLTANENFPSNPDGTRTIGSLQTPPNFTDYFASYIRGYIKVPTTETLRFNVTGDDHVSFALSTDQSAANATEIARLGGWTQANAHYDSTIQTSEFITLQANQYYYFELYHFEGGGGDNANVFWQKPTEVNDSIWTAIDFRYLYDYACAQNCPPRGTTCDDGDPSTQNDQQDGFCNCVGEKSSTNPCVGEREKVEAYYFDDIPGSYIENDLIDAPKFPLVPDRRELLKGAYGPLERYSNDEYGTLVQGYLTVPVSGNYEFNITGDNQTFFYMSRNDSIEYKQNHQAIVIWGIDYTSHDASSFQDISPLYLEKGKFYYYEFRHKESSWRDHFNLFWKTPFHEFQQWKRVPSFYLYDYDCELSCIAENTPCDDGDPFTNNDQIDANCDCVGTPCSGPDCDDLGARYQILDEAAPTNNLNTLGSEPWESCGSGQTNPNPARASYNHWLQYDFGDRYKFQGSRVWNMNSTIASELNKGLKTVVVDYSEDGVNWQSLGGIYNWPQASGSKDYAGFLGPNFNDNLARYILISAVDNWGSPSCYGFSKLTIDASLCNPKDTPCDDKDPLTTYDKFDDNCNCVGVDINCGSDTLDLAASLSLTDGAYKAKKIVQAESQIPGSNNVAFTAGNSIVLMPGFKASTTTVFRADIADCIRTSFQENEERTVELQSRGLFEEETKDQTVKKIIFRVNQPAQVSLKILDSQGNTVVTLVEKYYEILGTKTKLLPTQKLAPGTYIVELAVGANVVKESFLVGPVDNKSKK